MFYSTQILSKKGALGTIWIASHLEKRLKRSQIFETSIPASVDSIINPEAPLALRLSGQLLLGIVRVYLRKLEYLSKDAQSAVDNLNKSSNQAMNVDLEGEGRAAYGAITLNDFEPVLEDNAFSFEGTASDVFASRGEGFVPHFSTGDSLTQVEDVSDYFGSHWAIDDEKFEVSGEDVHRRFSVELERLRAEAAVPPPAPGDMFFQAPPDDDLVPVGDEMMDVPGAEHFSLPPAGTPAKTPLSDLPQPPSVGVPLPGTSDIQITPHILGMDLLPEVEGGPTLSGGTFGGDTVQGDVTAVKQAAPSPAQQRRQQHQRRRKKAAQLDVGEKGQPATTLSVAEIRAFLNNRDPLLTSRGLAHRKRPAILFPDRFDAAAQSEEARQSLIYRPGAFDTLAPELMEVYMRAMGAMALPAAAAPREDTETPRRSGGARGKEGEGPMTDAGLMSGGAGLSAGGFDFGGPSEFTGGDLPDFAFPHAGPEDNDFPEPPSSYRGAQAPAGPEEEGEGEEGLQERGVSGRRGSMGAVELGSLPGGGEMEGEGRDGSQTSSEPGAGALPKDSFTERSRQVLAEYRRRFVPGTGSKRRHPSTGGLAAMQLSLFEVVQGKNRGEACRWFYETLVLRSNDFVELEQREPYQDIIIHARQKLATTTDFPRL